MRLRKPLWVARVGTVLGIAGILAIAVEVLMLGLSVSVELGNLSDLQASEAAINLVVLLAIGVYATVTLEARFKRRAALNALYQPGARQKRTFVL